MSDPLFTDLHGPQTLLSRRSYAEAAFYRDLEQKRAENEVLVVPRDQIPGNGKLVECYDTGKEYVIIGDPDPTEDENSPAYHNCDTMGCGCMSHVITRFPKP